MKTTINHLKILIRETLEDEYVAWLKKQDDKELETLADEAAKTRSPSSKHNLELIQQVIKDREDFKDRHISYHLPDLLDTGSLFDNSQIYESKRNKLKLLKRLIREGMEEATGGKKVYVLHRPDTYEVFAVFSNEADANEALSIMKKNFIRNVHLDEASFDPSLEMIAKRAKNLAYGGG